MEEFKIYEYKIIEPISEKQKLCCLDGIEEFNKKSLKWIRKLTKPIVKRTPNIMKKVNPMFYYIENLDMFAGSNLKVIENIEFRGDKAILFVNPAFVENVLIVAQFKEHISSKYNEFKKAIRKFLKLEEHEEPKEDTVRNMFKDGFKPCNIKVE